MCCSLYTYCASPRRKSRPSLPPVARKPHSLHVFLHPSQFGSQGTQDYGIERGRLPKTPFVQPLHATTTNSSRKACSYLHRGTSEAIMGKGTRNSHREMQHKSRPQKGAPLANNNLDSRLVKVQGACIHPCRYACFCGARRRASKNSCISAARRRLKSCQHKRGFCTRLGFDFADSGMLNNSCGWFS